MQDDLENLKLTTTHEWVRAKGKNTVVVGISDYGQQLLSDITSVELPETEHFNAGEDVGVIESIRLTVDIHAPLAGTVSRVNAELLANPELINSDPFGAGWLFEMKPDKITDVQELMSFDEYEANLPEDEE
jgi:glycine cleavage system H protein